MLHSAGLRGSLDLARSVVRCLVGASDASGATHECTDREGRRCFLPGIVVCSVKIVLYASCRCFDKDGRLAADDILDGYASEDVLNPCWACSRSGAALTHPMIKLTATGSKAIPVLHETPFEATVLGKGIKRYLPQFGRIFFVTVICRAHWFSSHAQ